MTYHFEDFTVMQYRALLQEAKKKWLFCAFGTKEDRPHILLRHDVDFSVSRALRIAEIEAAENLSSTFFFMLHSSFYNILEKDMLDKVKVIIGLGHYIGLHFDSAFYASYISQEELEKRIFYEKGILEHFIEKEINVFSFHNIDINNVQLTNADKLGGLRNAYAEKIQKKYKYCSDSNGYWRFDRLETLIKQKEFDYMQILTHPAWWTKQPMSPFERIKTSAYDRTQNILKDYDLLLKDHGRVNVG